jgi:hypothetical protein
MYVEERAHRLSHLAITFSIETSVIIIEGLATNAEKPNDVNPNSK